MNAFNEVDETQIQNVILYFHKLNDLLLKIKHKTNICFSCRHFSIFFIQNTLEICVEEKNQKNIKTYVRTKLEKSLHTNELKTNSNEPIKILQERIIKKISNVFL